MNIIIIGMGISGLTAAQDLLKLGFDVTLIEAKNQHIGGRVFTQLQNRTTGVVANLISNEELISCDGISTVENGAGWIHYTGIDPKTGQQNPIKQMAESIGIRTVGQVAYAPVIYGFNNQPFSLVSTVFSGLRYLYSGGGTALECAAIRDHITKLKPNSISYEVAQQSLIAKSDAQDPTQYTETQFMSSRLFAGKMMQLYLGGTPVAAASALPCLSTFDGEDHFVTGGYGRIITKIWAQIKDHPKLTVHQGCEVLQIKDYDSSQVKVITNTQGTLTAHSVISTIPAGVLQNLLQDQTKSFFSPPLPEKKRQLIAKIHVGNMVKVFLHFKKPFWKVDAQYIIPLGLFRQADVNQPWFSIVAQPQQAQDDFTLMVSFYGSDAKHDTAYARAIALLKQLFSKDYQDPISHHVSHNWLNDPHARGAWCALDASMTLQDIQDLGATEGNLYFTGDLRGCDTVHMSMIKSQETVHELVRKVAVSSKKNSLSYIAGYFLNCDLELEKLAANDPLRLKLKSNAIEFLKKWEPKLEADYCFDLDALKLFLHSNAVHFVNERQPGFLFSKRTVLQEMLSVIQYKADLIQKPSSSKANDIDACEKLSTEIVKLACQKYSQGADFNNIETASKTLAAIVREMIAPSILVNNQDRAAIIDEIAGAYCKKLSRFKLRFNSRPSYTSGRFDFDDNEVITDYYFPPEFLNKEQLMPIIRDAVMLMKHNFEFQEPKQNGSNSHFGL